MKAATIGFNDKYSDDALSVDELHNLSGIVLLEFGTPWCSHCQASQEATKKGLSEYTDLVHVKVFDGKGKRLGRQLSVKLWPTLILLQNGEEIGRIVRFTSSEEVSALLSKVESR